MSEADFYAASSGAYRGSKYPGFTGGTTDSQGNVVPSGSATNLGASVGANASPGQVQSQQQSAGNTAANTNGSLTTAGITMGNQAVANQNKSAIGSQTPPKTTLGGIAAQTILPAAGNIGGTAVGNALSNGASFGEALSAGGEALSNAGSNLAAGNIGGLLGLSSSGASTAASSGAALGSTGANISSSFIGSTPATEGINFASDGASSLSNIGSTGAADVAADAGSEVAADAGGEVAGSALGSGLGAGLSGIGTFAADMLSGQSIQVSAGSGIGATVGGIAGSYFGPVGTVVGSFLGSLLGGAIGGLFGNQHPTVGPDGGAQLGVQNGQLNILNYGGDNGFDASGFNTNVAQPGVAAINKILNDNNLQINSSKDPYLNDQNNYKSLALWAGNKSTVFSSYNPQNIPETPLDLWNYMVANNMIESKTPNNEAPNNAIQTTSGASPVLQVPGSFAQSGSTNPVPTKPKLGTPSNPIPLSGAI